MAFDGLGRFFGSWKHMLIFLAAGVSGAAIEEGKNYAGDEVNPMQVGSISGLGGLVLLGVAQAPGNRKRKAKKQAEFARRVAFLRLSISETIAEAELILQTQQSLLAHRQLADLRQDVFRANTITQLDAALIRARSIRDSI